MFIFSAIEFLIEVFPPLFLPALSVPVSVFWPLEFAFWLPRGRHVTTRAAVTWVLIVMCPGVGLLTPACPCLGAVPRPCLESSVHYPVTFSDSLLLLGTRNVNVIFHEIVPEIMYSIFSHFSSPTPSTQLLCVARGVCVSLPLTPSLLPAPGRPLY